MKRIGRNAGGLLLASSGLLGFGVLWWALSLRYPSYQWPGPPLVFAAWREIAVEGALWEHARISLARFATAYSLALVAALPLGFALGAWSAGRAAIDPLLQVLRPISPIAWFPLAVLWFGVGDAPAVFIIALAAFFPILLATISGVRAVPAAYLKVSANFGASRWLTARAVVLPAAFPTLVIGLRIAVGAAWIHLVAGEMLGAQSGLGFLIVDARNFLRTDLILAGMITIGLLGLAIDRVVGWGERRLRAAWGQA